MVAEVKALACELPAELGLPLSRFSRSELRRHVLAAGIVAKISGGTIHRGQRAVDHFQGQFHNLTLVHLPTHASWLNQIEIYFSTLQRKALTPADFSSQDAVATRILGFQEHHQRIAQPFEWKFTRRDLNRLVARWAASEPEQLAVAA